MTRHDWQHCMMDGERTVMRAADHGASWRGERWTTITTLGAGNAVMLATGRGVHRSTAGSEELDDHNLTGYAVFLRGRTLRTLDQLCCLVRGLRLLCSTNNGTTVHLVLHRRSR